MRFFVLFSLAIIFSCLMPGVSKSRTVPKLPADFEQALSKPSSVTLYSIQPNSGPDIPGWDFHGYHQLGHIVLNDEKGRIAISALNEAISSGNADVGSLCSIEPRHGLRIIFEKNTYDFVICYQCGQLEIFRNGIEENFSGVIGKNPTALNNLLIQGKVPLADNFAVLYASYAEEAKIALKMANRGNAKAQEVIGKFEISGQGVKENAQEGIEWLSKFYKLPIDSPDFELKIGMLYKNGMPEFPNSYYNISEAAPWLTKAAQQGNAEAQYQIGYMKEIGDGIPKDFAEAMKFLKASAAQDNSDAEYELGSIYEYNKSDIQKNDSEAMKWFLKAANHSNGNAMNQLAWMYRKSEGTSQNSEAAYFWYNLSLAYHSIYANKMDFSLDNEQTSKLDVEIAEWKKRHPLCEKC